MLFLTPNQQCQSTKGRPAQRTWKIKIGRNKPHLGYAHKAAYPLSLYSSRNAAKWAKTINKILYCNITIQ